MQGDKQVMSRIPYDLREILKKAAYIRGISMNQLIIDALESKRKSYGKDC